MSKKTYESYKDLAGCTLKEDDALIFRKPGVESATYRVRRNHLAYGGMNSAVFKLAGIPHDDRYAFCTNAYGYKARDGAFPVCRDSDYPALTRVALELFKVLEAGSNHKRYEHFTSPRQLVTKGEIQKGDTFELCSLVYSVCDRYFSNMTTERNDQILHILDIEAEILDRLYGYQNEDGQWPEWRTGDYKAGYRALVYLFMVAEAKGLLSDGYDGSREQKEDARWLIKTLYKRKEAMAKDYNEKGRAASVLRRDIKTEKELVAKKRLEVEELAERKKREIEDLEEKIDRLETERTVLGKDYDALDREIATLEGIAEGCDD